MDENYFWSSLRYIEQNPVRAKMVSVPWVYPFSSASVHIGGKDIIGMIDINHWRKISQNKNWRGLLQQNLERNCIVDFQGRCRRGRPLGSDTFISKLEVTLGRRLRPSPGGRPKKKQVALQN